MAVNDQADAATLAHLLQYDSVHGPLAGVGVDGDDLLVRGRRIRVCREADPGTLPWKDLWASSWPSKRPAASPGAGKPHGIWTRERGGW